MNFPTSTTAVTRRPMSTTMTFTSTCRIEWCGRCKQHVALLDDTDDCPRCARHRPRLRSWAETTYRTWWGREGMIYTPLRSLPLRVLVALVIQRPKGIARHIATAFRLWTLLPGDELVDLARDQEAVVVKYTPGRGGELAVRTREQVFRGCGPRREPVGPLRSDGSWWPRANLRSS